MSLKKVIFLLFVVSCVNTACETSKEKKQEQHELHEHEAVPTNDKSSSLSPQKEEMAMINGAHIHIDYSSPSVRDRIIFGGLVAYDRVWQAGAHNATWIETDKDLQIGENILPAGKYGFFLIPRKQDEWSIIFNSRWDQHGKDEYDETEDVLRLTVEPNNLENTQESLIYKIEELKDNKGIIVLAWDKFQIEIPFKVTSK